MEEKFKDSQGDHRLWKAARCLGWYTWNLAGYHVMHPGILGLALVYAMICKSILVRTQYSLYRP